MIHQLILFYLLILGTPERAEKARSGGCHFSPSLLLSWQYLTKKRPHQSMMIIGEALLSL